MAFKDDLADTYTNGSTPQQHEEYQKGRKRCLEYEDEARHTRCSKKFCCEESMSVHMQQLYIASTPPAAVRLSQFHHGSCSSWWQGNNTTSRDYSGLLDRTEAIMSNEDSEVKIKQEEVVTSDDSYPTLWVAPEVKEMISSYNPLLPKEIVKEVSSSSSSQPCLELVPYIDHTLVSRQSVWSNGSRTPASNGPQSVVLEEEAMADQQLDEEAMADQQLDDDDELYDYIDDEMDVL